MSRPCLCDRYSPGPDAKFTPDQCRLCWLYHHDPDYRAHWDGPAAATEPLGCRHRGPATGATLRCASCRGTVALKIFACTLFGSCTLARQAAGVACCATCPDRDPALLASS